MIAKIAPNKPWLYEVRFGYNPRLVEAIGALQGATWDGDAKCWRVPIDHHAKLERLGCGFLPSPSAAVPSATNIRVDRKYQVETVQRALQTPGGFLCAYEMKLGKSGPALDIARLKNAKRVLIICPPSSRPAWEAEVKKWWPEMYQDVEVWREEKKQGLHTTDTLPFYSLIKAPKLLGKRDTVEWHNHVARGTRVTVCGYPSVHHLPNMSPDVIIIDEVQGLGRHTSRQSKAVRKLREECMSAYIVGLSGTPQANETASWFNPLDIIFPGRFGFFHTERNPQRSFAGKYCDPHFNGYGYDFKSIDPKFATKEQLEALEEFKERLGRFTHRVTKADVADLLPPMQAASRRRDDSFSIRELVESELREGVSGVALMFASREAWLQCASNLAGIDAEVQLLTGAETPEQRGETLAKLKTSPRKVAICSIAACALTIDLSDFSSVHFIELTDKVTQMSQVVGRFQTPSGKVKIDMVFWYTKDTYDQAMRLERKITALNAVLGSGNSEFQMRLAFTQQTRFTEGEWNEAVADALSLVI